MDPHLQDYAGKTPLDLCLDWGNSRVEVGVALARYAREVYAPSMVALLVAADRFGTAEQKPAMGASAPFSPPPPLPQARGVPRPGGTRLRPPGPAFCFLGRIGADALRLVARFLASPPRAALARLAENAARASLGGSYGGSYGGSHGGLGPGSPQRRGAGEHAGEPVRRFDVFDAVTKFDPRSRSLPYLLRQAQEESMRQGAQRAQHAPPALQDEPVVEPAE